jgi:hypothetical protein
MKNKSLFEQQVCDWQTVLQTVQGRRVLWQIIQTSHFKEHGFVPADGLTTAFHCGQRSIGLFVWDWVEKAGGPALEQMRKEYVEQVENAQQEINRKQEEFIHE